MTEDTKSLIVQQEQIRLKCQLNLITQSEATKQLRQLERDYDKLRASYVALEKQLFVATGRQVKVLPPADKAEQRVPKPQTSLRQMAEQLIKSMSIDERELLETFLASTEATDE